jgi:site-specific recombinase XerC
MAAKRGDVDGTIDAYLDHLTTERGLARHSIEAYGRDLSAFAKTLDLRKVRRASAIGAEAVRVHRARLSRAGLAPRSQAGPWRRSAAISATSSASACTTAPTSGACRCAARRRGPGRARRRDVTASSRTSRRPPAARSATARCSSHVRDGPRVSEAAALTGAQLRIDEGFVTVMGKGGKERIVPLGRRAKGARGVPATERPRLVGARPASGSSCGRGKRSAGSRSGSS